jgi:peptide/nickel transport system permease protein
VPLTENWRASIAATIMPAFVLGNAIAAILMRHTRSAMLQVLESDYVRTARAKGLFRTPVILKHAMRNALTPIIDALVRSNWARCVGGGANRADLSIPALAS